MQPCMRRRCSDIRASVPESGKVMIRALSLKFFRILLIELGNTLRTSGFTRSRIVNRYVGSTVIY
jgi:hypothetical protein